jgi:hypothetical protein
MKLLKKSQEKIKSLKEYLSESPEANFALKIFTILFPAVIILDIIPFKKNGYLGNLLGEVHGLAFDVIIFGILIVVFNKQIEKRSNIKRWQEEIDDYRGWKEPEATYRIVGNIKRLNREQISKLDLRDCFLNGANLSGVNLCQANLFLADLSNATLIMTNLICADLAETDFRDARLFRAVLAFANFSGADLQGANLEEVDLGAADLQGTNLFNTNFDRASLLGTNLFGAVNLTIGQIAKVKTLYRAKLDPALEQQVKEKYPHLLEKPQFEEVDEEQE